MLPDGNFNYAWYDMLKSASNEKEVIIDSIKKIIAGNKFDSCLEIGMGTSPFFANGMTSLFEDYTIVEKHIAFPETVSGLTFLQGDWEEISLQRKFDVIIASHVLYYFKEKAAAFEKMVGALSKNGILIVVVNGRDGDYGATKKFFFEQIGIDYQFTYDVLTSWLQDKHVLEFSVPSAISFDSYESLYESLSLSFDQHQDHYRRMRNEMLAFFRNTLREHAFIINQKIFVLQHAPEKWKFLIRHPDYEIRTGGMRILARDGVFSPDRQITWSTHFLLQQLPDVKGRDVLDIGCGTGIIAIECALQEARRVVAADISGDAVRNTLLNVGINHVEGKVKVLQSDLFEKVEGRFDYIFGNLPILEDVWELTESPVRILRYFLTGCRNFIKPGGKAYFTWASFGPVGEVVALLSDLGCSYDKRVATFDEVEWYFFEVTFG